jgi:hypothetical protein
VTVNGAYKKFKIKKIVKHAVREYITTVDAEDAHLMRSYAWAIVSNDTRHEYAVRVGPRGHEYLHHIVVGAKEGESVWHINGDTLDNRKSNLLKSSDRVEEVE